MEVPEPGADECVVGVTLPVPEPWAGRVRLVRAACGDPLALAIPPHVTLVPPTAVDAHAFARVRRHVEAVASRTAPFVIGLDGTGTFRPVSPVVYLSLCRGTAELGGLHAELRAPGGPFDVPARFTFHPHVTLAHDVADHALDFAQKRASGLRARFVAERIHLYRLAPDATWQQVDAPALGGVADRGRPASPAP